MRLGVCFESCKTYLYLFSEGVNWATPQKKIPRFMQGMMNGTKLCCIIFIPL